MKIHWYGHAAFLIETGGTRIILDPYRSPDSGGYEPIDEPADVVVVSHENDRYHSHLGQIVPPFEVVRALELPEGGREVRGVRFEAIRVFESPAKLGAEDEVTIVHFRAEGLHIAFLGDLGHALDEAELAPIRGADVVLVPAGGPPTIDFPLIGPLLEAIGPTVVVPDALQDPPDQPRHPADRPIPRSSAGLAGRCPHSPRSRFTKQTDGLTASDRLARPFAMRPGQSGEFVDIADLLAGHAFQVLATSGWRSASGGTGRDGRRSCRRPRRARSSGRPRRPRRRSRPSRRPATNSPVR